MILVTFALPDESRAFRDRFGFLTPGSAAVGRVQHGTLQGQNIALLHTGMGPLVAATALQKILQTEKPRVVVSSGFAGALDPEVPHAALILAKNLCSLPLGPLQKSLELVGAKTGKLHTTEKVAETVQEKAVLFKTTNALAVDMESSALASVALQAGIPFVTLRAVSDDAHSPMPVPGHVWFDLEKQKPRILPLLLWLATHPGSVPDFVRFVKGLGNTASALADGLSRLLPELGVHQA